MVPSPPVSADGLSRLRRGPRAALDGWKTSFARWWQTPLCGQLLVVVPIVLAVSFVYAFMASAGTFRDLGGPRRYLLMARGFESGQLHVPVEPAPALLRAEDPFHPANKPLWFWDATLYDGRYYLYWGPVPALLAMGVRAVAGNVAVNDRVLTLIFALGRLYGGAALILGLGRSPRLRQPAWLIGLAIAAFGLTSPIPFIVARPLIYEAALAAGQCFLFCGLALAFWGLERSSGRTLKFALAGLCWALAVGSRVTMVIPVPLLIVATAGVLWVRREGPVTGLLKPLIALGAPVTAALGAYALYNHARFGSFSEFGTTWQASTQRFFTNPVFVIPNLYSYLFAPVEWSCQFPFVTGMRHRPLASFIDWPRGYATFELVGGLLWLSAWCWLSLVLVCRLVAAVVVRIPLRGLPASERWCGTETWAACCSLAIVLAITPVLGLWEASMRYTGDAVGGLVIAASLSAFWLRRRADASGHRGLALGVRTLLIAAGAYTCIVGAVSGVASYGDPIKRDNPWLYRDLQRSLSFCEQFDRAPSN